MWIGLAATEGHLDRLQTAQARDIFRVSGLGHFSAYCDAGTLLAADWAEVVRQHLTAINGSSKCAPKLRLTAAAPASEAHRIAAVDSVSAVN